MIEHRLHVVVPAAGIGSRMQSAIPKQYLTIAGKSILQHTLEKLLVIPNISKLIVALHPDDIWFDQLSIASHPNVETVVGGLDRADSVLNALHLLPQSATDWVMVHDAARPLVALDRIDALVQFALTAQQSAILAAPVRDTMKRAQPSNACDASTDAMIIAQTVDRNGLWHAHTPQIAPVPLLTQALERAKQQQVTITDEASALEWAGHPVAIIVDKHSNLKVTQPEDLALAAFYLSQQEST